MRPEDLRERTRLFALNVTRFVEALPKKGQLPYIGDQLARAANAVAANYRAAGCARSRKEFIAKLGTVREESDEANHWLQMLTGLDVTLEPLPALVQESDELARIFASALRTAQRRSRAAAARANGEHPNSAHRPSKIR